MLTYQEAVYYNPRLLNHILEFSIFSSVWFYSVPIWTAEKLSGAIFPIGSVNATLFERVSYTTAKVVVRLNNGTSFNVKWEVKFKASDGQAGLEDHVSRFHDACDDIGPTMTVVKMTGVDGGERIVAGYNSFGWLKTEGGQNLSDNTEGCLATIDSTIKNLYVFRSTQTSRVNYDADRGPMFIMQSFPGSRYDLVVEDRRVTASEIFGFEGGENVYGSQMFDLTDYKLFSIAVEEIV
jgi:hypothetical protein